MPTSAELNFSDELSSSLTHKSRAKEEELIVIIKMIVSAEM
jgi:hypothetical protein